MKATKTILILTMIFVLSAFTTYAQNSGMSMEDRTRMMYDTFTDSDKDVHEKFIKDNFSKKLLEKYKMSRHMEMFKMLNRDFSDSKIVSIKAKDDDRIFMVIERNSDKHRVTFDLTFDADIPHKINGFAIEAGEL